MVTRADSAAATRDALLRAAADLLDAGGPSAVTLRAVSARAGVSRGAPYGHFPDKEHLLTQLVVDGWTRVAETLTAVHDGPGSSTAKLEAALVALLDVARTQPHLYALMWGTPASDPAPVLEAAGWSQDIFLTIVADVVGGEDARRFGALLMSSAHGIASVDLSGHLSQTKWNTSPHALIAMLVQSMPQAAA
ncbi:TetR/AcrR family transcriptional regulator [Leifsonia sp. 2TAF2]|uniref:TetR/AcrR family transcriptional regulator n=1 Tax=Leifsonia sp. 2TAF2 TaxID=3233009 RepID=UPI003F9579BA